MSILTLLLQVAGCAPKPAAPASRTTPGPDKALVYPVLFFSRDSLRIAVRDDAATLTTTSILRQPDMNEMTVIDSSGTLYEVAETRAVPRVPNYFEDSNGTKRYRVSMALKQGRKVDLPEVKRLLLEVVRHPKSYWTESHDGNGAAVKTVEQATTLTELIAACRKSSLWW